MSPPMDDPRDPEAEAPKPLPRDDIVDFTCGDHFRRGLAMILNGGFFLIGAGIVYLAIYFRFFSSFGRLHQGLENSRPYLSPPEEARFQEIQYLIDLTAIVGAGFGAAVMICTGIGCRSANTRNSCCLHTQVYVAIMFLLLQLIGSVGFVVMKDKLVGYVDMAWDNDIHVIADIGKGRNHRRVAVPPLQCAMQEALGCFGYHSHGYQAQIQQSAYYTPGIESTFVGGNGVLSCSGAYKPPSGGLMGPIETGAPEKTPPEDKDAEVEEEIEICCPTPAQRVIPRIQFDPVDPNSMECTDVFRSFIIDHKLYITGGVFCILVAQILLIWNMNALADAISNINSYRALLQNSGDLAGTTEPLRGSEVPGYSSKYT